MELEAKVNIKLQTIRNLQNKSASLQNVIEELSRRNEFLKANSYFEEVKPLPPNQYKTPDQNLVEQYFYARREYLLSEKKNQRLKNAHQTLSQRIEIAHSKLLEQQHKYQEESIQMLSPTVANILSIKPTQKSHVVPERIIEKTMLEKQLEAIIALQHGVKPQSPFKPIIDLDSRIRRVKEELHKSQATNQKLSAELSEAVKNYLSRSDYHNSFSTQAIVSDSFGRFLDSYHKATNSIQEKPLKMLLKELNENVRQSDHQKYEALVNSLNSEKEMIAQQLANYGSGDESIASLKDEINFQLLYLSHLTAVAGKALSKLSTEKEPIDPVEKIEADIAEMGYKYFNE
ncbi:hypothetical protein GPJ56_009262 [Histomonas meleagridis]|uniref:uncharacterized protein n=1 Tax=Histomonas meleagridis TaxID=135588 RepID=UPI00355A9F78|nr:hypothetical protein GPJ56_009262 [Histomonas meleagridis]KAH0801633.1 hypothetical protein GO595_005632 [Histomonas meleagridis]